jgi:hypothetical protein
LVAASSYTTDLTVQTLGVRELATTAGPQPVIPPLTAESTAVYFAVKVCGHAPTRDTTPPALIIVRTAFQENERSTFVPVKKLYFQLAKHAPCN